MDTYHAGLTLEDALGDEDLAGGIGIDDGAHQFLWHFLVVGEQFFGAFGQAVAARAERGVVVIVAGARCEADTLNDVLCVQPMGGGVGIEFIEIGHTHGEAGVGKQFDRPCLGGIPTRLRWRFLS